MKIMLIRNPGQLYLPTK